MRVLITGGSGFLGERIAYALSLYGHEVIVGTRRPAMSTSGGCSKVFFDLNDPASVGDVLLNCDFCIHLAWTSIPFTAQLSPFSDFLENVASTVKFAMLCKERKVKKFLFCSSGGTVYGSMLRAATELDTLRPISVYGSHKVSTEMALRAVFSGASTQLQIVRVANPYGSSQDASRPQGLVGHAVRAVCEHTQLTLYGSGDQIRDYIHVDDVASAFAKLVEYRGDYEVFNVGTGIGTSSIDLVRQLEQIASTDLSLRFSEPRIFDVDYNVLNSERLTEATGWRPMVSLVDGLKGVFDSAVLQRRS